MNTSPASTKTTSRTVRAALLGLLGFGQEKPAASAAPTTVPRRGIVLRCGSCVLWRQGFHDGTGFVLLLEGDAEPYHADSTEVLALTSPGDTIIFDAELEADAPQAGDTCPPRRYAFNVRNATLRLPSNDNEFAA